VTGRFAVRARGEGAWLAAFLFASGVLAQNPSPTGDVYGAVQDEQEQALSSVAVTLMGPGAPRTATSDTRGGFHFLGLSPGAYSLTFERSGFEPVRRDLTVALGRNALLTVRMRLASVAEAVTVQGEAPVLDSRETKTGANFEEKELRSIPTTRDPWAILRQVPGVLLANMNVSGAESAIQSTFVGKGSHSNQNNYFLDGVAVTDMAGGATPLYFDFDSLQDIEVVTGGSDPSIPSSGVSINLVTKRGTNELKGSARGIYSGAGWDYGLEAGGPLWKDHLWLWGAGARNAFLGDTIVLEDQTYRSKPTLEHWNAKLSAQLFPANSLTLSFLHFDKLYEHRNDFGNVTLETTWNQTTPTVAYRAEDSHVLSEKLFASLYFSYLDKTFTLAPEGGLDPQANLDADYVWRNSFLYFRNRAPQHAAGANVSAFFNSGDLSHDLKFGFGYKHTRNDSFTAWPGEGVIAQECCLLAGITRPADRKFVMNYYDVIVADTIQTGRFTGNVAVRFDYQQGKNLPSSVPASPAFPDLLPAVQYGGDAGYPITWRLVEPRVGATYALGRDRKTLLRASYSRFTSQLTGEISDINAFPTGPAYLYYVWDDSNGNHRVEPEEVDLSEDGFRGSLFVDPNDPGSATSVNRIAPDLAPSPTDELIFGVEREILPDITASLAYTHRLLHDAIFRPPAGVTRADYQYFGNAVGSVTSKDGFTLHFDEPYYGLTVDPIGKETRNRPDYRETYDGLELQLVKRLSHRWMLRASFAFNSWRKRVGPGAIVDPNDLRGGTNASGAVVEQSDETFINADWQLNVSGLVQLPLGIEVSGNFYGRQGYAVAYFVAVQTHDAAFSRVRLQIGNVDDHRLPDVYQLDLHVEKTFRIGNRIFVTPSLDCFNVVNSHIVLGRNGRAGLYDVEADPAFEPDDNFHEPTGLLGDRSFRGGVRISF
jgi:Carboxypeptidase regulatory-like domain/TonB-dependent Receptor Plug Domain